jgi:hypothetical protein
LAKGAALQIIETVVGVEPITDKTAVSTVHYTYSDKIRFDPTPQKIGGWLRQEFDYGAEIQGTARTIFSDVINGKYYTVIGTNEKLYSLIGSTLTNITPLETTPIAVANSLDTQYDTLVNNPFTTVSGSPVVTIADAESARFQLGDTVTFSGATGFAGLAAGDLNGPTIVRSIGVGTYEINVGVNANTSTSGGGAAVVRASGLITVNDNAHGQLDGDRVSISDASATGGITAPEINTEFIIRNVTINSFDVMTVGTATSSVSAGGGASTEYLIEIPDGALNEGNVQGYGAGLYGMGLYGTALVSTQARSYPRIWFADRYANTITLTPGNQSGLYQWFGSNAVAPQLITNAPTDINYQFVSDNIIVTFGAGNIENRVFASDQNNITVWTSSSTNQVFDDDIEGAGRLTSHVPVEDYNLIFTEHKTFTMRYIGLPFIWEIKPLDENIGLIAPMARCSVKGMGVWMGLTNFYIYSGGTVEVIRSNTREESTCLDYVFGNLNWGQKSKIFAWYNVEFNEVWFHYPSANSNECDRVIVVNMLDLTWMPHTFDRTAAEYPNIILKNPRLINVGDLYQHELGVNADGLGMDWELVFNKRFYGKDNVNLNQVYPDSIQTGSINFRDDAYLYPQSPIPIQTQITTVTPITEYIPTLISGRFHQYSIYSDAIDQEWMMGSWMEEIQKGPSE